MDEIEMYRISQGLLSRRGVFLTADAIPVRRLTHNEIQDSCKEESEKDSAQHDRQLSAPEAQAAHGLRTRHASIDYESTCQGESIIGYHLSAGSRSWLRNPTVLFANSSAQVLKY
jgi:hypothetical protein